MGSKCAVLVLGLGNVLLTDDGVGARVVCELANEAKAGSARQVRFVDGGTLGLMLLPEIEAADALIVVDAARFGGEPGEVRVFEAQAMDERIVRLSGTSHEVGLSDLIDAARWLGALPERRALVGVAPHSLEWGLEPSPPVRASLPAACAAVQSLIARWAA